MRSRNPESVDSVVETVRSGNGAALLVRGEVAVEWPAEFRLALVSGAPPDADLPGSGLLQMCAQLIDQVERLSPVQRGVLRSAFDPAAPDPDPQAVGLTVFGLLAGAAASGPVVCVVQRPELLDELSLRALTVTARRLVTESAALLFIVQGADVPQELAALPELAAREGATAITAG
jgi:hypothetical protein